MNDFTKFNGDPSGRCRVISPNVPLAQQLVSTQHSLAIRQVWNKVVDELDDQYPLPWRVTTLEGMVLFKSYGTTGTEAMADAGNQSNN